MNQPNTESMSRRHFLNTSTTLVLASVAAPRWAARAAAVNGDTLRVGLIGCGGRGTGVATQALAADNNVVLTAMADAFPDRIEKSLADLKKAAGDKVKVTPDHCFAGFDAYQQLLDSGVYEYPNTWEQAMNSQENLAPPRYDWNQPLPVPPVAMPGKTKFI
jgi:myo-inositol 2-dehydrogenase / D-chiro-inositol 1-dehydrogenase